MTPALQLAKTAAELVDVRRHAADLEARLAVFEKRAETEAFLVDMLTNPRAPNAFRPSSVGDFLEKRALIEKQNLEAAKLAVEMANGHGFEIGDVEKPDTNYVTQGSRADDEFVDYLLSRE